MSARVLEMWRTHDYAALEKLGGFAHDRVYVTFIALVYTAMAYMPQRFKPGQPPFHVVRAEWGRGGGNLLIYA